MNASLSGKKALVTGAGGFIGSHLCRHLIDAGVEVYAVGRRNLPAPQPGLHLCQGDVAEAATARRLFTEAKPDFVFNMAGHVTGARGVEHVWPALEGNLFTTVNLLTLATEIGCERIVLAGSLEEPDARDMVAAAGTPSSPYAASKYAASCHARMFHALYRVPVVIARIFMTYGPGQPDVTKLVPYTILSVLSGRCPRLGSGTRPMDWIYIDDLVAGLLRLLTAPEVEGQTIDLGSGEFHTARQAVETVCELLDCAKAPEFGAALDRQMEVIRKADTAATARRTGWRTSVSFRDGLARTVEWYRQQFIAGAACLP